MEQLALFGGPRAVTVDYNQYGKVPIVPETAYPRVEAILRSGDLSFHPLVSEFEKTFAKYVGAQYSMCEVNCTTCIQAALFAVGVGSGDEVLVPSFTFWATAGPIYANHAIPVFCDVNKDTHCIDPDDIEHRITPRTKAIIVVHVWGVPADMDRINAIAQKHGIKVVEDCAHAHGTRYHGKSVGILGDVGCFSLQNSKVLPGGEGGIVVTNNREYMERMKALGQYDKLIDLPEDSPYRQYYMTGFGFKHRMHPVAAAVALSNLEKLDATNAIRTKFGVQIEKELSDIRGFIFQKVPENATRIFAYHYIYFDESVWGISLPTLLEALNAEGLSVGTCGYGFLHQAPAFRKRDIFGTNDVMNQYPAKEIETLPVTEDLSKHTFMLPRFEQDTSECAALVQEYLHAFHKAAEQVESLRAYETENGVLNIARGDGRSISLFKSKR
ncbi:MAG: DegT/DnrJ/EryC1/StrS family aminotransferase [Ruthenibacterium sp.]